FEPTAVKSIWLEDDEADKDQPEHDRLQPSLWNRIRQPILRDRDRLRQHDNERRAEDRAVQRADAADDHDGDKLDRLDQRELLGRNEADLVRIERAADTGQRSGEREGYRLVVGEIDPHAARGDFRVADG